MTQCVSHKKDSEPILIVKLNTTFFDFTFTYLHLIFAKISDMIEKKNKICYN